MALENRSCGYTRIQGALANLGHQVGRGTIANILRENGIEPAPERDKHTSWSTFLQAHWECLAATDFFTVDVCTIKGLVTHYVLFFIDVASRAVKIAGITPHPDNRWMTQIAHNLTDPDDGFLRGKRRNHQGLGNRLLQPDSATPLLHHRIQRRQRLGGMLNYYHRAAA